MAAVLVTSVLTLVVIATWLYRRLTRPIFAADGEPVRGTNTAVTATAPARRAGPVSIMLARADAGLGRDQRGGSGASVQERLS
jgi:hypothetical protein